MCPISFIDFGLTTDTVIAVELFSCRLEGMDECSEIPVDLVTLASGLFRPKMLVVLGSVLGRHCVLSGVLSGVLSNGSHDS
mgnify:FL=1